MTSPTDVLKAVKRIIGPARRWEKEVRFNAVVTWGSSLLFFANPWNIFKLENTPGAQYLMPQGIVAITKTLFNQQLSEQEQITSIKEILRTKGYDGTHEGSDWKRTGKTHDTYKQLAQLIADYENTPDSVLTM